MANFSISINAIMMALVGWTRRLQNVIDKLFSFVSTWATPFDGGKRLRGNELSQLHSVNMLRNVGRVFGSLIAQELASSSVRFRRCVRSHCPKLHVAGRNSCMFIR